MIKIIIIVASLLISVTICIVFLMHQFRLEVVNGSRIFLKVYEELLYFCGERKRVFPRIFPTFWHRSSYHARVASGNLNCTSSRSPFIFSRAIGSPPRFRVLSNTTMLAVKILSLYLYRISLRIFLKKSNYTETGYIRKEFRRVYLKTRNIVLGSFFNYRLDKASSKSFLNVWPRLRTEKRIWL